MSELKIAAHGRNVENNQSLKKGEQELSMKLSEEGGHIACDSTYIITFSKWQNYRDGKQISGLGGQRWEGGNEYCKLVPWKRSLWWRNSPVSWLQWFWHESTYVLKWYHAICMYCTDVRFLIWILYRSYIRCGHWGNRLKRTLDLSILSLQLPVNW